MSNLKVSKRMSIIYSVVIPLKNEEENVVELIEELEPVMEGLQQPWELLCIDDGSSDATLAILTELSRVKPYLRTLVFKGNFGQSSAFDAGFRKAQGEFIITMDGDRQNDPRDIPKMIEASKSQDLVCGARVNRQDPWMKKTISFFANYIRSRFCRDGVKDTGCSLKIYRASALKKIKMFQGMHRFLPALFQMEGFRVAEVPVNHRERAKGATKYSIFNRSFNTVADMLAVRWMINRSLHYKIDKEIP